MAPQRITRLVPWTLVAIAIALLGAVVISQRRADSARNRVAAIVSFESSLGRQSNLVLDAVSLASLSSARAAQRVASAELANTDIATLGPVPDVQRALVRPLATFRAATRQVLGLLARDGATAAFFDETGKVLPAENTIFGRLGRAQADATAAVRRAERAATAALFGGLALALCLGTGLVALYVTARRRLDRDALGEANAHAFGTLVRHSQDVFAIVAPDGVLRLVSGGVTALFGCRVEELVGTRFEDLLHPEDVETVASHALRSSRVSCRLRHRDGYWLQGEIDATDLRHDPLVAGLALTMRDTSERHALETQLRHRAFHDALTELPNRALFFDRLEQAVHRAERDGELSALLFLDLDDFKQINDGLGHGAGDDLLVSVAERLRDGLRSIDTVGRLGGDEFGVLLERVGTAGEARAIGERLLASLRPPVALGTETVSVSASTGMVVIDEGAAGAESVLQRADEAMYLAKRAGKGGLVIARDGEAMPSPAGRLAWADRGSTQRADVERLLAAPELITPVFQPIVDLRSGLTVGYEALTRFGGPVEHPPDVWIAQAHRAGLGTQLEIACLLRARAAWEATDGLYLSVNLSPSALVAAEGTDALGGDLAATVIEVTENELISGNVAWHDAVRRLRRRGVRFAVDDAGAGVAGFAQIGRLRPEIIKLDRSLVAHIGQDGPRSALIDALVHFGHRIGAVTCAEGIETAEQVAALARLDVALGQGYAFARPASPRPAVDPRAAETCRRTLLDALAGGGGIDALGTRLNALADVEHLAALAPDLAAHLGADQLCVLALSPDREQLHAVADHGTHEAGGVFALADYPVTAAMLRNGDAVQVLASDGATHPSELAALAEYGGASMLMLPLAASGRSRGILELVRDREEPWSHTQIAAARDAARALGRLLERAEQTVLMV